MSPWLPRDLPRLVTDSIQYYSKYTPQRERRAALAAASRDDTIASVFRVERGEERCGARHWRLGSAWSLRHGDQTSYVECRYLHNLPGDEAAYVDTASLAARHRNVWVIQHSVLLLRRVGLLLEHCTV